ncbi:hypothetical protein EV191_11241 [Tamaricihabitans halophyticus]|uniref:DoxX-like protein n=1 Tax=Tamaricihabitans halophyticus TaxID=1262583 RepID=A0A4R2QE40_9PSEU|nr:hypothetical protein [Tamaricihabitans halophyticus]TCP47247.1 hypothetical protein EV191_11241 [Tamaricihabitans halophyticus]
MQAKALVALAIGRIVWGVLALVSPRLNTRLAGVAERATPEVHYLIRVFGSRATVLGIGYLTSTGATRRKWQRLALGVDICDTVAGLGHLRRGDVPRRSAGLLTAITGTYALIGAKAVLADRAASSAEPVTEATD